MKNDIIASAQAPHLLPIELVMLSGDKLVTDSRRVARHFGKRHDNVLQAVDRAPCSAEFRRLNFQETIETRPNPKGGAPIPSRVVQMTKDGFVFLVMRFTGKEAARIVEAYIAAFNAMADQLHNRDRGLWRRALELEQRDASSKVRASFGSRLMLERKREKPGIAAERALLEYEIQPGLLPN